VKLPTSVPVTRHLKSEVKKVKPIIAIVLGLVLGASLPGQGSTSQVPSATTPAQQPRPTEAQPKPTEPRPKPSETQPRPTATQPKPATPQPKPTEAQPKPSQTPAATPGAQPPTVETPTATEIPLPAGTPQLTAADVEAFLDGLLPQQLGRDDIAGATLSVVKDGKLLFAKGYGFADYQNSKPVVPSETLFRPGSVSKLFTWTAVMQLYEQGKLDLDRDVNQYLDFQIPYAYGPVTMKHILTHTAGFEGRIKDIIVTGSSPDLGHYVKTHIPPQIFPPGTTPAYSNYATALAGYIVERISGQPFNDYIDQHILKPLNMTHSTFAQPLPGALLPLMSNGYARGSGKAEEFEVVVPFPAGSLSSTATDMAQFMLAHLQDGQLGDGRILKPETATLMHSRLFTLDPSVNGMAHGFYEESRNGQRIIGHGGDTQFFHSDLHLMLDAKVGFFISYNSSGRGDSSPRTSLWESFLDRYFPYQVPADPTLATAKEDARSISGKYLLSLQFQSSPLRSLSYLSEFDVAPTEDGMIEVGQLIDPNGKPARWREVAPMTFRKVNGQDTLIFKPDQSGRMQMIVSMFPFYVFHRVGFWHSKTMLLAVVVISLLIMLLTVVLWPIGWIVRRYYGYRLDLTGVEGLLRWGVRIVFLLDLIFAIGLAAILGYGSSHLGFFSDRATFWFYLFQVIGVIGAIGTLVVLINAISTWGSTRTRIWGKLQATVFALACLGFLLFAFVGGLFKFTSNY
jgi:CubicO group peptidase (beta-lactamase class C family)